MDTNLESQNNDLSKQMSELITIVKNQQFQDSKEQSKSSNSRYNWKNQVKNSEMGGGHLRGPDINLLGLFRNGAPPIHML